MTNHKKKLLLCCFRTLDRELLWRKDQDSYFFCRWYAQVSNDSFRSLGICLSTNVAIVCFVLQSISKILFLFRCQNTLLYFLLWLQFSNLVQPVVFRRQVTRFEMKRGKHHMRRFGAVFDRRWQWGINLSIWGTTHKNTNNYFWRVFWYDTSNCEVCWKINPQLLKKKMLDLCSLVITKFQFCTIVKL